MRIECPECDELVTVERFTCGPEPDRLRFACPACEAEVTVTSAGSEDEAGAQAERDSRVVEDADGDDDKSKAVESTSVGSNTEGGALESDGSVTDVVLRQLWELVTEDFSEGSRHDAFVAACEAQNKLAFAAARYREWLVDHEGDEVALKRQKQILALAQVRALALSSRETKEKDPLHKALTAFLVMVVLLVLVIVAAPLLLRGARGCRAMQPGQPGDSQLRRPSLPMVNNLRRRGPNRQGNRGLTPRRHRRHDSQLINLKPPPRPHTRSPGVFRPAPTRLAPMRLAPMRLAPKRLAPMPPATPPRSDPR